MSDGPLVEIICSACGRESLLVRKPRFEGFKKVGETLSCAACGYVFAAESDVTFKSREKPQIFSDTDRSPAIRVFDESEARRLCRYCEAYVVNPFMQWCHRHRREVEATDSCEDFTPRTGGEMKPPPL